MERCGVCGVMRESEEHACEECGASAPDASRRFLGRAALFAGATAIAVSMSACYGGPPRPMPKDATASPTTSAAPAPSESATTTP